MKLTKMALALLMALSLTVPAYAGPQCTVEYPRGYKVPKGTKKKPLRICRNGDLETTWRGCLERREA